ncbi:MAG TPA: SMC family ATPase [Amnibacterium sp.]|nr:SMC family ATPase [Amnibacterium sp.]
MRILALRVAGFGPYRAEQAVDFRRFDDDGIFLISGRTGAGKSSILDAVCFALYGDVPRFERRESQVRSQHCGPADPSEVQLDFQVRDTVYRIRRTPRYERLKRSGSGTTTAEPEAELAVLEGEAPRVVATRPTEVGIALAELLPISKDQFLQVILLAQNRFQDFLLAPTDKRRDLLRTLFGTDRFQRLEHDLLERRNALAAALAATATELAARAETTAELVGTEPPTEPGHEWFERLAKESAAAAVAADAAAAAARARLETAERALQEVLRVQALQIRRDDARRRTERLTGESAGVAGTRARLAAARRAEAVHPPSAALALATETLAAARAALAEALAALRRFGSDGAAQPGARIEALLTLQGVLAHPRAVEAALPQRRAALSAAEQAVRTAVDAVPALEARIAALPARIAALDDALAALALTAAQAPAARAEVTALTAALEAARAAATLAAEVDTARRTEAAAATSAGRAAAGLDSLLTARVAGQAVELAAGLSAGEPCPVCGSAEHPRPARGAVTVGPAEIEAARADSRRAQEALAQAATAVTELERRLATISAAAAGQQPDAVAERLAAAADRVREADEAAARLATVRAERAEAAAGAERLAAELATARERVVATTAALTERRAEVEHDLEVVAAACGTSPTVAARADAVQAELDAVRRATAATSDVRAGEAAAAEAAATLAAVLTEQGFADAEEAAAARLDPATETALDAAVRTHEQALAAAVAVLAEPELAALPEEPVSPAPLLAERDEAAAEFEAAVADAGGRRDRARAVAANAKAAVVLIAASGDTAARYGEVRDLAATVHGDEPNTRRMRLETYVLAAQLEQIIAAANLRLARMTAGRYALDLDDERQHRNVETGLGIGVRDAHTGLVRQAASLSGGEMFLASLALALGLAEVVSAQAGGIRLDTLFVDEGFGSLDAETLDTAMAAIDDLRTGGRTIGLISHVESMQERIPAKLAVEVLPTGDSRVVQDAPEAPALRGAAPG